MEVIKLNGLQKIIDYTLKCKILKGPYVTVFTDSKFIQIFDIIQSRIKNIKDWNSF